MISSSVRVNRRTWPSARWAWILMPSSFHSTAPVPPTLARASAILAALAASIGRTGRPAFQAERAQRVPPARQRRGGHRAEGAAQHHGPPDVSDGHRSRPGHRLGHDALQRSLPEFAGKQAVKEPLLVLGGPAEQLADQGLTRRRRSLPGHRPDRGQARVHLGQGERGYGRGRESAPQRGPADADLPLRQLAGQVGHGDRHLERPGLAQRGGQRLYLREPGARSSHGPRHLGDLGKEHTNILPSRGTRTGQLCLAPRPRSRLRGRGRGRAAPGAQSQYPTGNSRTCR